MGLWSISLLPLNIRLKVLGVSLRVKLGLLGARASLFQPRPVTWKTTQCLRQEEVGSPRLQASLKLLVSIGQQCPPRHIV